MKHSLIYIYICIYKYIGSFIQRRQCRNFSGLKAIGESVADPVSYYDINVSGAISFLLEMPKARCIKIGFSL
jgi:UDP-glucose 4-epimerase